MGEIRDALLEQMTQPTADELRLRAIRRRDEDVYWRFRREGRSESVALHYALDDAIAHRA